MIVYHVTNHLNEIIKYGKIKPCRLKSIYVFRDRNDAEFYKTEFGLSDIIECVIESKQIESRWQASYGYVIKLKENETINLN